MYRRLHLLKNSLRVVREHFKIERVALFVHLERIRQHSPHKGHILLGHTRMIGVFDVDGRYVVCEQKNLITPNLISVFQR